MTRPAVSQHLNVLKEAGLARGWPHYLERLVVAARGDDPGEDPWGSGEM